MEGAALTRDTAALSGEGAVHQLGQATADGEPQPGAAVSAGDGGVNLAERLEEAVHCRRRDPDARVANINPDLPRGRRAARRSAHLGPSDGDEHLAALGELHRVGEKVQHDLTQPARVAHEDLWKILVDAVDELQALCRGGGGQDVQGGLDGLAQDERPSLELDAPGLDLGEVEDVVDDRQQGIAGGPDGLGVVALLVVEGGIDQEPAHPDHRVERRADLVAHGRQERALGLIGLLRALPCLEGLFEQARVLHRDRGLLREPYQEVEIQIGEVLLGGRPPDRQHAADLAAHDERGRHEAVFLVLLRARDDGRARVVSRVVDHLCLTGLDDASHDPGAANEREALDRLRQLSQCDLGVEDVRIVGRKVDDA